jgi:hypothetical protein
MRTRAAAQQDTGSIHPFTGCRPRAHALPATENRFSFSKSAAGGGHGFVLATGKAG